MIFEHKSVLLYETVDSLNIKPDGIYVDGTLGGGGHAFEVASRLGENGRLIGIDQDADAIKAATERLEPFNMRTPGARLADGGNLHPKAVLNGVVSSVDGIPKGIVRDLIHVHLILEQIIVVTHEEGYRIILGVFKIKVFGDIILNRLTGVIDPLGFRLGLLSLGLLLAFGLGLLGTAAGGKAKSQHQKGKGK